MLFSFLLSTPFYLCGFVYASLSFLCPSSAFRQAWCGLTPAHIPLLPEVISIVTQPISVPSVASSQHLIAHENDPSGGHPA